MAKYNREFLVPYLQNICALHLAKDKIEDQYASLYFKEKKLQDGAKKLPAPPTPPTEEHSFFGIVGLIGGISSLFLGFICYFFELSILAGFLYILGACHLFVAWFSYTSTNDKNEEKKAKYKTAMDKYNKEFQKIQSENKHLREHELPAVQAKLRVSLREKKKVERLLVEMYDVNIIPSRYRDIYVAIYLYDWFSTSQADDLDMALSMFVLEEIKDKLDTIIANQAEIILNQCMILANQQKSFEQQHQYNQMMQSKLNRIAASNEERNIYLSMIESNTAATAYFAAADYIRQI